MKYIKLDDAIETVKDLLNKYNMGYETEKKLGGMAYDAGHVFDTLPTIEASEDHISREWIKEQLKDKVFNDYTDEFYGTMQVIDEAPSVIPNTQSEKLDRGYLIDWFINSVTDDEPIWTEGHIDELMSDFDIYPKGTIPIRPSGEWIETQKYNFHCSECGQAITRPKEVLDNYCPNCGSDNRGKANGNE